MILKSINLSNFGSFKDFYLSLPEKGLIYIDGRNLDQSFTERNGVGKSTLIDSVPFCLYGRTLREGGKKKLAFKEAIRHNCNTASVVIELDDNGDRIKVGRDITKTRGLFWVEYKGEILKGDFAQDFFKKKFDLNFQAFLASSLFAQGMYNFFLASSEEEKVGLLEELFRLNELEEIRQSVKGVNSEKGDLLLSKSTELRIAETEYRSQETKYRVLKDLHDKNRKESQEILSTTNLGLLQDRVNSKKADLDRQSIYLEEVRASKEQLKVTIAGIRGSIPHGLRSFSVGDSCPTCGQVIQNVPDEFKTYRSSVERKNKEIESLTQDLKEVETKCITLLEKQATLTTEYNSLLFQLKQTEEKVKHAKEILSLSDDVLEGNLKLVKQLEVGYNKLTEEVNILSVERDHCVRLYKLLGEKELRSLLVGKYLDLINYYAKQYVSYLTNGEVDLEFEFVSNRIEANIKSKSSGRQSYLRYSGGERRRIDMGIFLAFNMVNRRIFKSPLNLLLLDEVLDSLDEVGIERCISLLKQETDNIGLILVTGHQEGLRELFNESITLEKKGGSTIVSS